MSADDLAVHTLEGVPSRDELHPDDTVLSDSVTDPLAETLERQNARQFATYVGHGTVTNVTLLVEETEDGEERHVLDPRAPSPVFGMSIAEVQERIDDNPERHPLAVIHLLACRGGHWWDYYDMPVPEHYRVGPDGRKHPEIKSTSELDALDTADFAPDPPAPEEPLQRGSYVSYDCRYCGEKCLNRRTSKAGETRQCWLCASVPV